MKKIKFNAVDWDYEKKEEWVCPSHQYQSPIDIVNNDTQPMNDDGDIILRYRKKMNAIVNTGYCVQGYLNGVASINNRNFEFQQFHFHAKGEHTIDGKDFPLELHLVHQSESGKMAVIAIHFEIGTENPTIDNILNHLDESDFDNHINLLDLVPKNLDYYHYLGSLTTPPLTENVEWYVLIEAMTLSKEQLRKITTIHKDNYRETQDLGPRKVLKKVFNQ
ncbi:MULTISPECIES: carbonic anhydrase family protein [Vagococcus]|uniref:Carbonic anhydrase n=1 Tax=Vagococcus fluvialis bH819 TaxID=1255619 RepID=A0A1X6WKA8_9ENTE|nr:MULTISPECIES: carbonic anhydrase family protein [Vagococcus]SLM84679.1 Carbonic anhydrase [Vagococcus fluvialis bH819]HCM89857.1 carbonic anhydrase family protein [Vagococcus sp.]